MKRILLVGALCFFWGCGTDRDGKYARVNFNVEPVTIDPGKGGDVTSSTLQFMVFEGLTRYDSESSSSMGMAERVEVSEDKLRLTFHLRESVWDDGSPLKAQDFERGWKRILRPDFPAPNSHLLFPIKNARRAKMGEVGVDEVGLRCPDERTFVVELEAPTPYFLELTSFCVFFPVHEADEEEICHFNGPFVLEEWKATDHICVKKNPRYWETEKILLPGIEVSLIEDEMSTYGLFEGGDIDVLGGPFSAIPIDIATRLKDVIRTHAVAATTFCTMNTAKFPFTNQHIRKAFSLAVDRAAITEHITQMRETPSSGIIPPVMLPSGEMRLIADQRGDEAREELRTGLKELGVEKLPKLELICSMMQGHELVAQAMQSQIGEVLGVEIGIQKYQHKVFMDKLVKRDYEMGQAYLIAQYNHPMNILDRFKFASSPKNYPGWENKDYIAELDATLLAEGDVAERHLRKAEAILASELPFFPIYHWSNAFLINDRLKGLQVSPIGSIHWQGAYIDE